MASLLWWVAGLSRAGAGVGVIPKVFLSVGGTEYGEGRAVASTRVPTESLNVRDVIDETPNTAAFQAVGFTPTLGQEVIIRLNAIDAPRFFAGPIINFQQIYLGEKPALVAYQVNAIDYTLGLNRRKVIKRYTAQSATAIVIDLMSTFTSGYTVANVAAGLPTIDEITFTNQDLTDALTNLAKRIGAYWFVDYYKDLHFFLNDASTTNPTPLTPTLRGWSEFVIDRDASQWITRVLFEGGGVNARSAVVVGDTILPVDDNAWYLSTGGVVVAGPQRITYTGTTGGNGGSLVGPGASPASAPTLTPIEGTGIETGVHKYASTHNTASGESLPSPLATITTGPIGPPTILPTLPSSPSAGTGPDPGVHTYGNSFVVGAGETTVLTSGNNVTTYNLGSPANPGAAEAGGNNSGFWAIGASVYYVATNVASGGETTASGASGTIVATAGAGGVFANQIAVSLAAASDPNIVSRWLYRNVNGAWTGRASIGAATTSYTDSGPSFTGGSTAPPSSATIPIRTVPITGIQLGPAGTTARRLYRTVAGGSQLKLLATIANNTATTYTDTTTDAGLGANAPTSNTTALNRVNLSAIAIGPSAVTSRKLYRTVAGGSQLKLLATIADNTTTTYADTTADASLGANAPTSDASGLQQPAGQVLAGSTSVIVAGTGAFSSAGGWAAIGNGQQIIRYTGISSGALTGVPASGIGAVTATVNYNSSITAVPALTGIPASGAGAIVYPILQGDPINLLVQVDDLAAQADLASKFGGDGVQEEYVQDRRNSYTEALARATAILTLGKQVDASIRYVSFGPADPNTRSGRTISTALPAPTNVTGDFKIQEVNTTFTDKAWPKHRVTASSRRYSLEDLQRRSLEALK